MAKERMVNTRFWADSFVSNLDPTEKLLFLYLITNQYTDICGIYELPLKYMAVDTGIEKEMIEKILKRFEKDKKIKYVDGWVYVVNFAKYQRKNPKVLKGVELGVNRVPKDIYDRLCIDYDSLSHPNSNLNPNPNSNSNLNPNPNSNTTHTYSDVKHYFISKNYPTQEAEQFFNHYESQGWVTGNGIPISNWKLKAENWHKEQTKRALEAKQEPYYKPKNTVLELNT